MTVNISFIKLRGKIVDNYILTKKNWRNKEVNWNDLPKVLGDSTVQYSPYSWKNGYKTPNNFNRDNQDCIVWDIDDGMSLDEFQKMFKSYQYVIGTTKTHQKEKKGVVSDRFRVVIKAINIPSNSEVYFRTMELLAPFNDLQTLTPTASFLGNNDCIILTNEGKALDMFKASSIAEQQLEDELKEKMLKQVDRDLIDTYHKGMTIETLKEQLTFEIVVDVLTSVGYEVIGNKFKLREDERTNSANVNYKSLNIKDYGSDYFGDIFDVLQTYHEMDFREALRYVKQFI